MSGLIPIKQGNAVFGRAPGDGRMPRRTKHAGHQLAVLACALILADTAFLLVTLAGVLRYSAFHTEILRQLFSTTPLPLAIYALWLMGVAGAAAAIVAIVVYGFRERWFWRCLLVGSVAWLAFPPVHALIGLIALVVLLRCRPLFPNHLAPEAPGP